MRMGGRLGRVRIHYYYPSVFGTPTSSTHTLCQCRSLMIWGLLNYRDFLFIAAVQLWHKPLRVVFGSKSVRILTLLGPSLALYVRP